MFYAMQSRLVFSANSRREELVIQRVSSVEIESSWKLLTDRAIIVLPRNTIDFDSKKVSELFRVGDECSIFLGYNGNLVQEFQGYVTKVSADIPLMIKLEDEMWRLKQMPVNVSMKNATLPELLAKVLPSYKVDALDIELGTVRFPKTTVAQLLKRLQEDYSLYAYMKGKELVCGKVYSDDSETVNYGLENNVISTNLKYQNAEDIRIKIEAISTQSDGSKLSVSIGDEDGELRQLSYYNITNKEELKRLAELDLLKYSRDGYEGDLTSFGLPVVRHGYKANMTSTQYPERNGRYYVESVKIRFNDAPEYRRIVQIGEAV